MDAKQSAALREEFPAAAIGKLPKPYKADSPRSNCRECGSYHGQPAVHLDYVGHAATTDRLLKVDPAWSWEPLALTPEGLPALDRGGNLWIRLTVAGVTRIGVGDGKSAKECIGDAIRNAAMRFGVALDLWAKEDLHAMDTESVAPVEAAPENVAPVEATRTMRRTPPADTGEMITPAQMKKLHASFNEEGITDRDKRLAYTTTVIGHAVDSSNELTKAEASAVIDSLGGAS